MYLYYFVFILIYFRFSRTVFGITLIDHWYVTQVGRRLWLCRIFYDLLGKTDANEFWWTQTEIWQSVLNNNNINYRYGHTFINY